MLPLDQILTGDCRRLLADLPEESVDLVFADPPYNLQLAGALFRPNLTRVDAVDDHWDQFESFEAYDTFTTEWLAACRRVLKPTGTIWVIGSYHNIHRVGRILMDLGCWILNDVVWVKTNPMPNFRGVRFTNAHETLIWAKKSAAQRRYTFHYHVMKALNGGKQMRSDWLIPLCTGRERLKVNGSKAHTTQKPERLLERIILSCSNRGDVVLDPFFGAGTTGAVCRRYGRRFIGVETEPGYVAMARQRVDSVETLELTDLEQTTDPGRLPRIPFSALLDRGVLTAGQELVFAGTATRAQIESDAALRLGSARGSIHHIGCLAGGVPACNGWKHWLYQEAGGRWQPIDALRQQIRAESELRAPLVPARQRGGQTRVRSIIRPFGPSDPAER
jgi:DNA modification methylase